jgi:hypothetical protein
MVNESRPHRDHFIIIMLPPSSSSTLQLAPEALDPEFVAVILAGRFSSRYDADH